MEFVSDFVSEPDNAAIIKVVGIGGGGCNAINRMVDAGLKGVTFIGVNTDRQALSRCKAEIKVQLGEKITGGRGAGANPEVGQKAAEESIDEIIANIQDADMVFITAGMGGGTGTGAAPIIAKASMDCGALTVAVVTKPFTFEGKKRWNRAAKGIQYLSNFVDSLVVIPNERLKQISENRITLANAFDCADEVLRHGVQSISDLINIPGIVNLDFADVTAVMKDAGYAHMGVGEGSGRDKAETAAKAAISSPLLETTIAGATGILISITASPDVILDEVETASSMISSEAHPDATIIWGAAFDNSLEDTIKVTVIATGLKAEDVIPNASKLAATSASIPRPQATTSNTASFGKTSGFNTTSGFSTNSFRASQPAADPQPATQMRESNDSDALISDKDFDDIMTILKKNRG